MAESADAQDVVLWLTWARCPQVNLSLVYADMAELADAQDLESCGQPCRFNPCYPHQKDVARAASFLCEK